MAKIFEVWAFTCEAGETLPGGRFFRAVFVYSVHDRDGLESFAAHKEMAISLEVLRVPLQ